MTKEIDETKKRDIRRAALLLHTADVTGVTPRHVRRVTEWENENEVVEDVFMFLSEGTNKLLEEAKRLVPFPKTTAKKQKA